MPGFAATPTEGTRVKSGLSCPHCKLILRDPVQTEDGLRLCRSCFDEIAKMPGYHCKKCDSTVTPEEFYPDRAVQRELARLVVFCLYKDLGCDWQGVLKEWEGHSEGCKFKGVSCPFSGCDQMLLVSGLEQHKQECSFRPTNCEHCDIQLKFHELEKHHDVCTKYPIVCSREGCREKLHREQLSKHQLLDCVIEDCIICKQQVYRSTGVELGGEDNERVHLSAAFDNFKHHQSLAMAQRELQSELISIAAQTKDKHKNIDYLQQLIREDKDTLTTKIIELRSQVEAMKKRLGREAEPQAVDNTLAARVKYLEQQETINQQTVKNQKKEISELKAELLAFRREYHQQQQRTSIGGQVSRHTSVVAKEAGGSDASESRVLQIERRLEEVARQANSAQVQVQEVELQLQASLASTYNGGFLWRIPDIPRRRRDAVEERVVSLYSPPFYTSRNGYKMCIRAYLNGDGMGYKTHFSLFFVLMKGEFDALLKWPFDHKISMILVDQDHRKHIVQTFKPTEESNSFQRPRSDMNVASGCPKFAKLSVLDEENYVRDNVLFVKCIVDTSKIFHP